MGPAGTAACKDETAAWGDRLLARIEHEGQGRRLRRHAHRRGLHAPQPRRGHAHPLEVAHAVELAVHHHPPVRQRLLHRRVVIGGGDLVLGADAAGLRLQARAEQQATQRERLHFFAPDAGADAPCCICMGAAGELAADAAGAFAGFGCTFASAHLK